MSKPHAFFLWRFISRRMCKYCGLIELRNERSRIACGRPCKWWED